ncbi:hypothetical protein GGS21DRAFT_331225 [Xylaria nigripes]|nr:hypothetical protein GGS21DRAFT_331225 [Xylaria nigripes]
MSYRFTILEYLLASAGFTETCAKFHRPLCKPTPRGASRNHAHECQDTALGSLISFPRVCWRGSVVCISPFLEKPLYVRMYST